MLTAIERKAATIFRKKKSKAGVYDVPFTEKESAGYRISSTTSWHRHPGIAERSFSPRIRVAADRTHHATDLAENNEASDVDFSDTQRPNRRGHVTFAGSARAELPRDSLKISQETSEVQSPLQANSKGIEVAAVPHEGRCHQALLLTEPLYQDLEETTRTRDQLKELDSNIAELAEKADDLRVAKETLECLTDLLLPGTFPEDGGDGDMIRRRMLMAAIRRRLGVCNNVLENLRQQRCIRAAELDVPQQRFLDALGQALRDRREAWG